MKETLPSGAAKGREACISSTRSGSTTVRAPASSASVLRVWPSCQLMQAIVPVQENAILVLGRIFQQAVIGDLDRLSRTGVSKEPAYLLGAVGIFGNQLALQARALHGQAAFVVDQALGNGVVDPQVASSLGQVGRDFKAYGFAHGQAAGLVGLLSDGGSCP